MKIYSEGGYYSFTTENGINHHFYKNDDCLEILADFVNYKDGSVLHEAIKMISDYYNVCPGSVDVTISWGASE